MRAFTSSVVLTWAAHAAAQSLSGKNLRIMPLGDSITVGQCGDNGNGYRLNLTNMLDGNQVNMIGSFTDGSARDNQFEAHGGYYVDQIHDLAIASLPSLPNVYLIHAGTNNLYTASTEFCAPAGTGSSSDPCQATVNGLSDLLNTVYYTGALLVVAQITPTLNSSYNARINVYNQLVANLVNSKKPSDGWRVQLANMQSQVTMNDIDPNCGGANLVHPNPTGYAKMANVWYNALVNASAMIPAPRIPYGYADSPCSSVMPNQTWCPDVSVYNGRGQANVFYGLYCSDVSGTNNCTCNDGGSSNFTVTKMGTCADMSLAYTSAVQWADLNGDGRQENVWISATGGMNTSLNLGVSQFPNLLGCASIQSNFKELGLITPAPSSTERYQVRLADLDGDARAEFIVVNTDGSATGYYNTGSPHTLASGITINFASSVSTVAPSFGVPGAGVRFADINGDGKADYVYIAANGSMQVWLNNNTANTAAVGNNWIPQGNIGPAVLNTQRRENTILADVDDDGRWDYLVVNRTDGTVGAYLNKPPSSGSKTPNWTFIGLIASAQNASAAGATQFLADVNFADPDGDGHYDYLVTNGGDSSIQGLKNICY